jgi:MATE family multidrug resistance protein
MGLDGAAWAFLASTATYTSQLAAYTVVREWRRAKDPHARHTWGGFSRAALGGWGTYLRFAAPSAAMICMEWW